MKDATRRNVKAAPMSCLSPSIISTTTYHQLTGINHYFDNNHCSLPWGIGGLWNWVDNHFCQCSASEQNNRRSSNCFRPGNDEAVGELLERKVPLNIRATLCKKYLKDNKHKSLHLASEIRMLFHCRAIPQHHFAGTHLYSWVERAGNYLS